MPFKDPKKSIKQKLTFPSAEYTMGDYEISNLVCCLQKETRIKCSRGYTHNTAGELWLNIFIIIHSP